MAAAMERQPLKARHRLGCFGNIFVPTAPFVPEGCMPILEASKQYFPTCSDRYLTHLGFMKKIQTFRYNNSRTYVRIADVERLAAERAKPELTGASSG
jgi:hypothetical protein